MKREWKPGDAASLTIGDETVTAIVRQHKDDIVPVWVISGHSFFKSVAVGNDVLVQEVRPLVVIDPEDREQVERLESEMAERCGWSRLSRVERANALQAALREFANPTPPKPDEPMGLGAVVEDADGRLHIRTSGHLVNPWRSETDGTSRSWARISAVRVLSEGVVA